MNKGHPAAPRVRVHLGSLKAGVEPTQEELRLAWRRGLPETIIRSLASDYLRGEIDDSTRDGYEEYMARGYDVPKDQAPPKKRRRRA